MTGYPENNFPAFNAAGENLIARFGGHMDFINPAKLIPEVDDPQWEHFMRDDIVNLMGCDGIILLDGWENSRGAQIEILNAFALDFDIAIYDECLGIMQVVDKSEIYDKLDLGLMANGKCHCDHKADDTKKPQSILQEAEALTGGARQDSYGHPKDNFKNIADFWTTYINGKYTDGFKELDAEDVGFMMVLLKVARELNGAKKDSLVDSAGYLNTIQMIRDYREK